MAYPCKKVYNVHFVTVPWRLLLSFQFVCVLGTSVRSVRLSRVWWCDDRWLLIYAADKHRQILLLSRRRTSANWMPRLVSCREQWSWLAPPSDVYLQLLRWLIGQPAHRKDGIYVFRPTVGYLRRHSRRPFSTCAQFALLYLRSSNCIETPLR